MSDESLNYSLENIRLKLLDLTMRNKLLNYAKNGRKKRIIIVDEQPDQIYEMLVNDEKAMLFDPVPYPKKEELDENGEKPDVTTHALGLGINIQREAPEPSNEKIVKHMDNHIQTLHYPDEMERILKKNFAEAKQAIEETGANMLYLVIGFLEWKEAEHSDVSCFAPLVMIPVKLEKAGLDKKTLTYKYRVSYTGEDIVSNLTLREKFKRDFGLILPEFEEDMTPEIYFEALQPIVESMSGARIIREFSLDFLLFSKINMYLDLDEERWPEEKKINKHHILENFFKGSENISNTFAQEYFIDDNEEAKTTKLIRDADSSQHSAIIDVIKGENLVIEGPPGTGKSQTITNIIAAALYQKKKVLFVAEKLAALDVVKKRLEEAGLGSLCLELHSHKSHKQRVFKEIDSRLKKIYEKPQDIEFKIKELNHITEELNAYADLIATKHVADGNTFHDILWKAERYRVEGFDIPEMSNVEKLTQEEIFSIEDDIATMVRFMDELPDIITSPWYGFEPISAISMDAQKIETQWNNYLNAYKEFLNILELYGNGLNIKLKTASSLDDVKKSTENAIFDDIPDDELIKLVDPYGHAEYLRFCSAFEPVVALADKAENVNFELIEDEDELTYIQKTMTEFADSNWFSKLFSSDYRKCKRLMKGIAPSQEVSPSVTVEYVKSLKLLLKELKKVYEKMSDAKLSSIAAHLGIEPVENYSFENIPHLIKSTKKFASVCFVAQWLKNLDELAGMPTSLKETIRAKSALQTVNQLKEFSTKTTQVYKQIEGVESELKKFGVFDKDRFYDYQNESFEYIDKKNSTLPKHFDYLSTWIDYSKVVHRLYESKLGWLVESLTKKEIEPYQALQVFRYGYYYMLSKEILRKHLRLGGFSRQQHEQTIQKFKKLDEEILSLNRQMVAAKASQSELPAGKQTGLVGELTEMGLIKNELRKKTRHVSLRSLLKRAPKSLMALKPCFMMSPMSCAQYLEPGKLEFDLLVIDEASQIKPEDSFGVIARAKQIVVVGDPKQLPPTSFFDRANEIDEESASIADDAESILDLCMQTFSPYRRLKWHYRSKHESLIAFSNQHFYDGDLLLFPSPNTVSEELGIKYHYIVSGQFINQYNIQEAEYIVKKVVKFFLDKKDESLGVVAMNAKQSEYIADLIEDARKHDPNLDSLMAKHDENHDSFFVKNLENVQGDERDVIFISTTYGPDQTGKQYQRFGPINSANGWRRLNVLITRAKKRVEVFTSMLSSNINITENSTRGHIALKEYLKYIESGLMPSGSLSDGTQKNGSDSDFEVALTKILREAGYEIDTHVGAAGYYIDIAIRHPNRSGEYLLAIECDGSAYFCAKSARDRDRLKEAVLKRMGWSVYRIWSVDWFSHRDREIERLMGKIESVQKISK